ncbi:DUF4397 domain-containing protein [Chondromyces crocatus]|uniref:DUF4397 domain-containing protein n=1 Tax=Chondromyces crocatus TaxID=52 RepID=A0A0K1EDK3_CHOCO|nr:DUF4397 domain-containing protein [Chondromyces crocatus]AKT38767.1 uncharacterized protein CMC5_029130 [Chondromyces crocatus]
MTKRGHGLLVIGLMLGVSGVNVGCGAEEGVTVEEYGRLPDRGGDGGGMGEGGPGGRGGSDDGRPEVTPQSELRVAHLSPNGAAFDVCLIHGDERLGPLMGGLGVEGGIKYTSVTRYFSFAPGTYTIRLVDVGALDCESHFLGASDMDNVVLAPGRRSTLAALGEMDAVLTAERFRLELLPDESSVASGSTSVRLFHAVPDAKLVDIGEGSGAAFSAVVTEVPFGRSGVGADGLGFLSLLPRSGTTISVRLTDEADDLITSPPLTFHSQQASSVFVVGNLDDLPRPLAVMHCNDLAEPSEHMTNCQIF